jgi:hypothetical protein
MAKSYNKATAVSVYIRIRQTAEWSVSRYDEAIVSLGFMVRSMNFDLKLAPQILFFSTTSKPKSIEIP